MILNSKRYDALDMTSAAEFGTLKDTMYYSFWADGTIFYESNGFNIAVSGDFPPMPNGSTDPRSYYPGTTKITAVDVFGFTNSKGWILMTDEGITLDKFYSARTIDGLLNLTEARNINGSYYNDNLLGGNSDDRLVGFEGGDVVRGRAGADTIDGGDGNDDLFGDTGEDNIEGGSGQDLLEGGSGNDYLAGGTGDDTLNGGEGSDILIGNSGADRMVGGIGNDTYYVDDVTDVIIELAGSGSDTVFTGMSYSLAPGRYIEILAATSIGGTAAINLTGNEIAQRIGGNNGVNVLSGGGGNDNLFGYDGNDVLNGGVGADRMFGGLGNDRFYVDNAGDTVFEAANQGTDSIYTSVHYTLAAWQSVEVIATTSVAGTVAINLAGNNLGQQILGNNGANRLVGDGGNDTLTGNGGNDLLLGGVGNDRLTGGAGFDKFVFDTALNPISNVDRITDFSVPQDTIVLENAIFKGIAAGTLTASAFVKNTTGLAADANDRIIYETDTGKLFYDSNGNAAGGSVHFATVSPNLALTNADFQVI